MHNDKKIYLFLNVVVDISNSLKKKKELWIQTFDNVRWYNENNLITYYVPAILFVFALDIFRSKIMAIPKSEILGFISMSTKMLPGFRSQWIIGTLEYLYK